MKKRSFFAHRDEVLEVLKSDLCPSSFSGVGRDFNVALIIVESLSREYMGWGNDFKGHTPFLDNLAAKSLFFPNTVANAQRSIESLPSILASVPHFLPKAFPTTPYMENHFLGLGQVLQKKGYTTSFFHGGQNGTMYFDATAARLGFSKYYGMSEYPHKDRDYDGAWGIFDEPFLQFFVEQMGQQEEPWASVVFTLSSHHPYKIPDQHQEKFVGGELPIHRSIEYADWSLQKFFEKASEQDWFNRTLFLITADHTQKNSQPSYRTRVKRRLVPLYFYLPGLEFKGVFPQQVQQLDIMPSILTVLGEKDQQSLPFSQSVFSQCYQSRNLFSEQGAFWLTDAQMSLKFDGEKFYAFDSQDQAIKSSSQVKDKEDRLKASLQYFFNGLIENNW